MHGGCGARDKTFSTKQVTKGQVGPRDTYKKLRKYLLQTARDVLRIHVHSLDL